MPRQPLTAIAVAHGNIRSDHAVMQRRQNKLGGEVIPGGLDDDRPSSPVEREDDALLVVIVGRGISLGTVLQHRLLARTRTVHSFDEGCVSLSCILEKLSRRGRR